jgi:hypothetical protein
MAKPEDKAQSRNKKCPERRKIGVQMKAEKRRVKSSIKPLKREGAENSGELVKFSDANSGNHQDQSDKKNKNGKNEKKDKKLEKSVTERTLGTARGIESMFRNSYRAQLDMITLAATKANIMISLNGSLLALLTLSSAYILTNEPRLLLPTGIFLLTCIVSIFFAVLAARPQKVSKAGTRLADFRSGRADLLVFEHYAQLSKDEYMTAMMELMRNREGVYKAMLAHLHFLGLSADRRFRLLHVSYSAFFVGLVSSFIVLAIVTGRYFL